jgi:hypothetical protein
MKENVDPWPTCDSTQILPPSPLWLGSPTFGDKPLYSAATATSAMNCDTHLLRRLTFPRYIASNSASGNECVEGRLINVSAHAIRRGYFSMRPIG